MLFNFECKSKQFVKQNKIKLSMLNMYYLIVAEVLSLHSAETPYHETL
jgi:hypothetical protein